jgi:hypothetical protein
MIPWQGRLAHGAFEPIAFFAFAPIGPNSEGGLKVINRTYLFLPSESLHKSQRKPPAYSGGMNLALPSLRGNPLFELCCSCCTMGLH